MANILIVHGTSSTPDSNWYMWLKGKLVGRGYKVWLPLVPSANTADSDTTSKFLLGNPDFSFTKETILIGHSSGATAILELLQNLPDKAKVKAAILVSPLSSETVDGSGDKPYQQYDFDKIKQHCSKITIIHSDDDPYAAPQDAQYLATKTNGELIVFSGQGNFSVEVSKNYKQFPEIIQFIDEVV